MRPTPKAGKLLIPRAPPWPSDIPAPGPQKNTDLRLSPGEDLDSTLIGGAGQKYCFPEL